MVFHWDIPPEKTFFGALGGWKETVSLIPEKVKQERGPQAMQSHMMLHMALSKDEMSHEPIPVEELMARDRGGTAGKSRATAATLKSSEGTTAKGSTATNETKVTKGQKKGLKGKEGSGSNEAINTVGEPRTSGNKADDDNELVEKGKSGGVGEAESSKDGCGSEEGEAGVASGNSNGRMSEACEVSNKARDDHATLTKLGHVLDSNKAEDHSGG